MGVFCQIYVVQPPNNTFSPGSVVRGTIKYAFDEETTVKRISVSLVGDCYLDVLESRGSGENETRNHDVRSENYVNFESVICDGIKTCPVGSYETKYNFVLPENIPSSLNYYKNYLTYEIKCVISYKIMIHFQYTSFFKLNKTFESEIKVTSPITPKLKTEPVIYGERKKLFQLFGSNENTVNLKACIQNSVIEPGGKLEIMYELENNSNKTVNAVSTKLMEIYTFKIRKTANLIKDEEINNTESKSSSIKSGKMMAVPVEINVPFQIGNLEHSTYVSRDYAIVITVELPIPHTNMVLEMPIQIGNIELKQFERGITEVADESPPSYWEAMNECEAKK